MYYLFLAHSKNEPSHLPKCIRKNRIKSIKSAFHGSAFILNSKHRFYRLWGSIGATHYVRALERPGFQTFSTFTMPLWTSTETEDQTWWIFTLEEHKLEFITSFFFFFFLVHHSHILGDSYPRLQNGGMGAKDTTTVKQPFYPTNTRHKIRIERWTTQNDSRMTYQEKTTLKAYP